MAQEEKHDARYCACLKYKPKRFRSHGERLKGILFRCRTCWRYVDPKKWKGGVVVFTNRSRLVKYNECPCCGKKMSMHRRAKKKLVNSMEQPIKYPELLIQTVT